MTDTFCGLSMEELQKIDGGNAAILKSPGFKVPICRLPFPCICNPQPPRQGIRPL